ncbi:aspartate/glutamate racemase family protein [Mitsuaria sp. 7]|uniref:aspartate/glutamate racemase family protein n=1 Tax=Mitsuaria sp. 7 TaxID=1658665 RepID=UPI0007DE27A7|nr:aspartate/glutamate racemase family protein [Mitsuaria sp. 7]ANH67396.1 aspartate racemase [Mitsuaria sp. 7]
MHVGLIVGIGPAATDYYYRLLIAAAARAGVALELTMSHADVSTLLRHQAAGDVQAQVEVYLRLAERLARAGAQQIAVTSIAGHFCIDAFKAVSPRPVIDLLQVMRADLQARGLQRVGLLGTRGVMASRFYGVLDGVDVIAPVDDLLDVHEAYAAMASAGIATPAQREVFMRAGRSLTREHGCEAVLLAGTDLALVFGPDDDPGFPVLDCAAIHAAVIARTALQSP